MSEQIEEKKVEETVEAAVAEEAAQPSANEEENESFADKIQLDEKVQATKNFFGKFWDYVKVSFTQSFPYGIKQASTEKAPYWAVIFGANVLLVALSLLVGVKKLLAPLVSLLGSFSGGAIGNPIGGGYIFLIGLVLSLLFIWIVVGGLCAFLAICKKKVNFHQLCNVVAIAILPLTLIWAANILINLIYAPLGALLISVGYIMFFILLYIGVQSLAKFQKSPFLWFSIMVLAILIVYALIGGEITNSIAQKAAVSAMEDIYGNFDPSDFGFR